MLLKDIPYESLNANVDHISMKDIENYISITMSKDLIDFVESIPFLVLYGTFGMGKTTIFKYLEKKYISNFSENRNMPVFVQYTIQKFHEIIKLKIDDSERINYFSRAIFITIIKQIRSVIKDKKYDLEIEKDQKEEAIELINNFIENSKEYLKEIQTKYKNNPTKGEIDLKFLKINKGAAEKEDIAVYSISPPDIFAEFEELIENIKELLSIEKFIFLFDETFAIYRNFGIELFALFLSLMKGLKSQFGEFIELKLTALPFPKPPKTTYFRIPEDFQEKTIQYINYYSDSQEKISKFFTNLLYHRISTFKDHIHEFIELEPEVIISQIFEMDAWNALIYFCMGVPRTFFLMLSYIKSKILGSEKINLDHISEAIFTIAKQLINSVETETNKNILNEIINDLKRTNQQRSPPNFTISIFITYPNMMNYLGLIEELIRYNILVLTETRIAFDQVETRKKLNGENYGMLFTFNLCIAYNEKMFYGEKGGQIQLPSIVKLLEFLNQHSSKQEYRSKIRDFIPNEKNLSIEEIADDEQLKDEKFIEKAEEDLDEFTASLEREEIEEKAIPKIVDLNFEKGLENHHLPDGFKFPFSTIMKALTENQKSNLSFQDITRFLRYRNGVQAVNIGEALFNLAQTFEDELKLFYYIFTKTELQNIARHIGVPVYGNKDDISRRILNFFQNKK